MKKFLRTFVMLALLAVPWITQAQYSQTFDFENNAIPAGWTNDATYPWVVTTSAANGGTHCIKSGNANVSNSTSSISVTITYLADGEITFAARASCEQTNPSYDWDYGTFYIDGVQQGENIIDNASFTTYTYPVTAGQHTFVWKYKKDGSVSSNDDCLYIDDVVIAWENADCPKPLLTLGTYTTDMATVSWTEVENAEVYLVTLIQGEDFIYDNEEVEDLTFDFDELEPGTTYTVEVRSECGLDEPSNASIVTFTTFAAEPVSEFPYLTGFEDGDDVGWELVNDDTKADKWYIGSAVNNGGSKSLYISDDGGITNSYSENYDNVYAYRNFVVEEWGSYYISFDWRCYGEGTTTPYDYLTVYLAPASSAEPQAGSEPQSSWLQIGSIFNQVQTWQNFSTILDNVQPGAYRLIFRWRSDSSTQNDMPAAIDNVNVVKVSCPAVASVVADEESITPYSASISWEYGGDATDFIVVNAANTEETYEVSGETSYTIVDLIPNTQYTFKVYVSCGDEDISIPANVTFRTACAPIASLPYTEDFENVPSVSNPMPYCWTKYNTVSTGTLPYVNSGASNAHNGQKYLYFYYSTSTGQPDYVMAILPELDPDVNSITNSQLSFWARTNSATGSFTLQIGTMSDPTDPETFELAEEKTITGNTYNRYDVAFNEAPEENVYAVIRMNNPSASAYVYVDDVTLMEIPSCAYVNQNNIEVLGTTAHSVQVSWTDEENEDASYNIYDMSGEEPVLVAEGITLEDLPYTIDENVVEGGLASSTTFHYGLAAVCGGDVITDISDFYFTTECEAISVFPWTENFDSYGVGDFNAMCWVNEHIEGSATYIFKVSQNVGGNTTKVLQLPDQAIGNMTKLVLPEMILPGDNYMLTIDMYRSSSTYNTSYPSEGIRVFVSTNGEIEGATELAFIPRHYSVGNSIIPTEEAEGWYNYELPIGVEGNCYIILRGESQYCTATYMDNLTVKQIPTCRQPNALAVSEIGPHQVTLSWTERGEATEWEVSYVPVGGNQSSNEEEEEVEEVVPAETNPFVLTGLDYETGYIVKVRANCGEDGEGELDLSEWSEPLTFTTAVACPGIAASSITAVAGPDYVNLTWPSNNVEDATYNVYKYIPGETEPELVGENVDLPTAEEPFVVDGLDPETQYTFGVKPICDEGDAQIATVSVTTSVACPTPEALAAEDVTATEATLSWLGLNPNASYNVTYRPASAYVPVFEDDFENGLSHWTVYTLGGTSGSSDDGWYVYDMQGLSDYAPHSGDYVVSSWSWNTDPIDADNWLVSPLVTLGSVMKYWELTNSGYPDSYEILFSTTGNTVQDFQSNDVVTLRANAIAATTGDWNEVIINTADYAGQEGYIAIHHEDYDANYLLFDDFGVYNEQSAGEWVTITTNETSVNVDDLTSATTYEFKVQAVCGDNTTEWTDVANFSTIASCLPATDLAVEATTTTSVTLTWTDNNDGSAYVVTDVEDNEVSFTMLETGMGCVVTGLEPNTAYTFKVKASCGDGDYSTAVSIHTRTACTAISELPFTEGFEEAIGTRYCWTLYSSVEGNNYPTFLNNATYSHNGNTSLYIYNDGTVETFIAAMPPVNPDMISLSGKQVSFWARTYGSNGGTIQIGTMSDINNPETFVLVDEVTVTELEYERYDILLGEVPEGNIYVAVRMIDGENGSQFMIDDITLMEAPTCNYVRQNTIEVSEVTAHSATVTWSDEFNEDASYMIYVIEEGEAVAFLDAPITLSDLPQMLTGLTPETDYVFAVAAVCSEDNESEMTQFGFTTTIACPAPTTVAAELTPGNGTIATITWTEVGEANQWEVQLGDDDPVTVNGEDFEEGETPHLNLTGLTAEQEYTVKVRANCGEEDGMSAWSTPVTFIPTDAYEVTVHDGTATNSYLPVYGFYTDAYLKGEMVYPAAELSNMSFGSITSMTFYASTPAEEEWTSTWQVFLSEVDDASISSFYGPGTVVYEGTLNGTASEMTINFTTPYQYNGGNLLVGVYNIAKGNYKSVTWIGETVEGASVQGYDYNSLDGVSPTQRDFLPKTTFGFIPGEAPACEAPTNAAISDVAAFEATFNWEGTASEYVLEYKAAGTEEWASVTVSNVPYTLEGLEQTTTYLARVKAVCDDEAGYSLYLNLGSFTTPVACPTPTDVVVVNGPTKAFVTWTARTNEDATYIIYDMSEANPEVYDENVALPTAENPYVIEGLDPETQYSFGVAANCGDVFGQSEIVPIDVQTTIACPAPANLSVITTTTTATLTWVDGNSENATYVIYDLSGEEPVAITEEPITFASVPYEITGLQANTEYTFGVQALCDGADPAELTITSITFTTECDAVAIPYTEEFVSIDCWRQDGNGTWTVGTGDYSTSTGSYSGTTNARITHVNTGDVTKLISPVISNAENGMRLQFAYVMRQWVNDIDELRVYYRSSATDEWNQIGEYTEAASTWTVETIDITNAVYQVAFEYTDGYGYGVGIDQVVFNVVPTYYTVNTPVNPVNAGTVTAADDVNLAAVLAGTSVTITANPAEGYQFVNWTIGETTVTDNPYTFQVTEDMEITANFELIPVVTYAVTLTYIQTQGSVIANVENLQEIEAGTEVSLNAVPATGYQFVGWTVGETTITDNPYVFEIDADMAITANFELIPATYAVTIATVENGFVYTEYDGNLSEVLEGTEVTFIATASTGYQLAGWTVNGEAAQANEDGTLTVTIDADKTIAATFELIPVTTYNVSVNTSVGGNVNPIGNQTVVAGEGLTVTATPNTGYHFVAWMQGENLLSTDNPYTYYPEADNTSITATFEENAAEDVYYSIMASANPTEGTVSANVALGQVLENTEVSITATPNAHYEFVNWIENGVVVSTANPYTFTATADRNLVAYFNHIVYEVNLDWSPEMGTVTGLPEQDEFEEGDQFFLTATANEGYHFVNWTINNETVEGSNTMVTVSGDMTIVANFAINTYAVTVVANNGTVEANVEDLTAVNHYTQVTFTATPATGYELSGWTVNGVETESNIDGTLTITVTAPTTVAAVFTLKTYTVTLATVENGSIATAYDGDLTAVAHGTAMTFTATPAEGYQLEGWTVNGTAVTANPDGSLTVSVTANITVAATFTLIPPTTYTVTIATVQNGTISTTYTGDLTAVVAGTELTFTATPAQGYELSGWTVNGEAAQGTGNSLTVTVNANITVAATFTLIPPTTYTVTIATVEHGTISANIDNLTAVVAGTEVTFTATPAQGYELSGWTVNGQAAQGTGNQLTVTVNANITVAATFTLIPPTTYTVTIATVEHGTISANIDNLTAVVAGTEVTFTATPAEGYELEGWTVNGQAAQGTGNTLTVTVNANITVAATFTAVAPATIDVTFTVNDPNMGSINPSGTQTYTVGTQVTVTATANVGYEFYGWELTVNGLTTTLTENVETTYTVEALAEYDGLTVKALFKAKVGIDDVDMNNVTIYSAEDVIYVRGAEGRNVTVFDLNGRVLNQTAKAGEVCEFRMNNTGIYLVKVGNAAAKRVAVVR